MNPLDIDSVAVRIPPTPSHTRSRRLDGAVGFVLQNIENTASTGRARAGMPRFVKECEDMRTPCLGPLIPLLCAAPLLAQQQQFGRIGDFRLADGGVIRDCRIGYRTFGKLDAAKSNVIVVPTWANGTTEQLQSNIGPGRLLDPAGRFVILVDALANGVSSSPSNSRLQPRMQFPRFTVADMVASQHELLTRILDIEHVKAVMGVSMGGMQTFQWMVSYPDFMDKAIPIVGSPRLAPYDLLLWQAQIDAITHDAAWKGGDYSVNPASLSDAEFGGLLLTTPWHYNDTTTRAQVFEQLKAAVEHHTGPDANNKIRQAQAMMAIDVSKPFGGSMAAAAARVKAKVLVIVSKYDHVVTPGPARDFAHRLHAPVIELQSDCGHQAPGCAQDQVRKAVADFLK
jgi:homoserine acetyltransferase